MQSIQQGQPTGQIIIQHAQQTAVANHYRVCAPTAYMQLVTQLQPAGISAAWQG